MRPVLFLSIWLFCAFRYLEALELRGQEGGLVHISCPYDSGYERYTKYFKRGIYNQRRAVIQTSEKQGTKWTRKGRYGLYDDISRRILLVTISDLTLEDAGTYWCEIDAYLYDPKTEVMLTVAKAPPPLKPQLVTSSPPIRTTVQAATKQQQLQASAMTVMASGTSLWSTPLQDVHTGKELYSGVALAAAVLLLTLLLVSNTIYEEIPSSGHQRDLGPSVTTNTSSSVLHSTYAVITSHRGPDTNLPSNHNPDSSTIYNSPINSCLETDDSARVINQREENICSSSPSTEAGDKHSCITVGFSRDSNSLHYSTACFNTDTDSKPKRTAKSAAEPSEIFSLSNPREKGHYTVTISSLTEDDAGKYWCAMKRIEDNSISQLTEVQLHILNWDDIKPKEETGDTGKTARLQCNYPRSHEDNEKFLCKGESPFNCKELINATQHYEAVTEGRFTVRDNTRSNYFTVHIKHLCQDDTGTYWCGSDRTWQPADYTRIHLTVATSFPPAASVSTPVTSTSLTSSSSATSKSALNGASLYTTVSVGLALLLIAVTVIIIYRHKINKTQGAHPSSPQKTDSGNNRGSIYADHDYEEVEERLQQPDSGSALPSSVYATVNLPTNPSDYLQYASVSFHKSPHCADEASVSM
ncbi:polymeric immunoglobulin receptor-like [Centroberyx affinis]|uniref:polymeric immunoglobulin receptor-like n=1 Tax=Centroberyx affinis TaxID=166261 RepID=UPI003A5C5594